MDVAWSISERMDFDSDAYSVQFYEVAVSQAYFSIQEGSVGASAGECSESFSHAVYEEYPDHQDFQLALSEGEWIELMKWTEGVEELLKVQPPEDLRIQVRDGSRPDCIRQPAR